MMNYLRIRVFVGDDDEGLPVREYRVGPFAPQLEPVPVQERRYSPVERFKSALNQCVECLNHKCLPMPSKDEKRLDYTIDEYEVSDSSTMMYPDAAVSKIARDLEAFMTGRTPRAA